MPRHVFYSFHYDNDCHRASQVRNIGAVAGNKMAHSNEWETVKRAGDGAIRGWIDRELDGKSCLVVLIGAQTASRRWCLYEIQRAWGMKKAVLGVHIHGLKNLSGQTGTRGANPIVQSDALGSNADAVPVRDPQGWDSQQIYGDIANNISTWIDEAITVRQRYS